MAKRILLVDDEPLIVKGLKVCDWNPTDTRRIPPETANRPLKRYRYRAISISDRWTLCCPR